jgi:hypothetical protein
MRPLHIFKIVLAHTERGKLKPPREPVVWLWFAICPIPPSQMFGWYFSKPLKGLLGAPGLESGPAD